MRSTAARVPLVLLVVLTVGLSTGFTSVAVAQEEPNPAMTMRVLLEPDGDAQWTVTLSYDLDSEEAQAAFEELADQHVSGEDTGLSSNPFEVAAARSASTTERDMAIENQARSADRDRGALSISFTWTNFARSTGDRLELGDVFHTNDGTWLSELTDEQVFVIEFPNEYSVQSASHPLQNRTFVFEGPRTFDPGNPSATLIRQEIQTTTQPNGTGLTTVGPNTDEIPPSLPWLVAAIIVVAAIVYLIYRQRSRSARTTEPAVDSASPDEDPDGESAAGEPLLSDEEQVVRLLRGHDGRMKQAAIVDATDWSNAKVSQLLSDMAESGKVEKLRIGRENLISLPDENEE